MFGKQAHDLNSMAAARWQELVETLGATEAGKRATGAWDVLAGRSSSSRTTWPMIRAAAIGVALGWLASEIYRRRQVEIDQTVGRVGEELRDAKVGLDERLARAKATPGSPIDKAKAAMGTGGTQLGNSNAMP